MSYGRYYIWVLPLYAAQARKPPKRSSFSAYTQCFVFLSGGGGGSSTCTRIIASPPPATPKWNKNETSEIPFPPKKIEVNSLIFLKKKSVLAKWRNISLRSCEINGMTKNKNLNRIPRPPRTSDDPAAALRKWCMAPPFRASAADDDIYRTLLLHDDCIDCQFVLFFVFPLVVRGIGVGVLQHIFLGLGGRWPQRLTSFKRHRFICDAPEEKIETSLSKKSGKERYDVEPFFSSSFPPPKWVYGSDLPKNAHHIAHLVTICPKWAFFPGINSVDLSTRIF